ncbi:MAG: hypothetical protein ABH956_02820 [Candidatus Nealsonbacteria bacterium]
MKFSKVKGPAYFAVINLDEEMPIFVKDIEGRLRNLQYGKLDLSKFGINPDTEVQVVRFKL